MPGNSTIKQPTPIRPYSLKDLSQLYGMSVKTINRWLDPFKAQIGERNGWYYTIQQVEKIFSLLGRPGMEE